MQMLWWWGDRTWPPDLWIPCYAQSWESTHAHVSFARVLHGAGQCHYGAHGDAVGATGLHRTCSPPISLRPFHIPLDMFLSPSHPAIAKTPFSCPNTAVRGTLAIINIQDNCRPNVSPARPSASDSPTATGAASTCASLRGSISGGSSPFRSRG
jgi:hypothetical protein